MHVGCLFIHSRHCVGGAVGLDHGRFNYETEHDLRVLELRYQEVVVLFRFLYCGRHGRAGLGCFRILEVLKLVGVLQLRLDVENHRAVCRDLHGRRGDD